MQNQTQNRVVQVTVQGQRTFYVDQEWASIVSAMLSRAEESSFGDMGVADTEMGLPVPVRLKSPGPRVIACLKEVRQLLGISLRNAKEMVDKARGWSPGRGAVENPTTVLLGVYPYGKALEIRKKFAAVGATVVLPGPLEMLARVAE